MGSLAQTPFMQIAPEDIDEGLRVDFEHSIWAAQAAAKRLLELGSGCFPVSPQSDYTTGAVLTVDGGYLLTKSQGRPPIRAPSEDRGRLS